MKKEKLLEVLCRACDRPLEWNTELLQSGYLDSLAMVLLEEELEMAGENTEGSAGNPDDTMGLVPDEYPGREA